MKQIFWVLAILTGFSIQLAHACDMHDEKKCHHHGKSCGMHGKSHASGTFLLDSAKDLDLTDAQVGKLNRMRLDLEDQLNKKEEELDKANDELVAMVHNPKADRKKIEEKTKEIGKLEGEKSWIVSLAYLNAYAELTDAQKKKLKPTQ